MAEAYNEDELRRKRTAYERTRNGDFNSSKRWLATVDQLLARAEKAEAECKRMREALEAALDENDGLSQLGIDLGMTKDDSPEELAASDKLRALEVRLLRTLGKDGTP